MKIYISGKISGENEAVTVLKFAYFQRELEAIGLDTINPIALPHEDTEDWEKCLALDLYLLREECAAVFAIYDNGLSKGARLEILFAQHYGIPVFYTIGEIYEWYTSKNKSRNRAAA